MSYYFYCDWIRRLAIVNWCTVGDLQKHIVSRRSLPVAHFFRRCFFHLQDSVKNKISETPECAAFPILRLSTEVLS